MANHKSAIKRQKQTINETKRNGDVKSSVKTAIKKFKLSLSAKKAEESSKLIKEVVPLIQKAASKGVLHNNNASRKISRLTLSFNKVYHTN